MGEVGYPCSGIKYRSFLWSLVPDRFDMPSLLSLTVSLSRVAVNPASQNCPMDRRGCFRAGKTSHFQVDWGIWGNDSMALFYAIMVSLLGMRTCFSPYRIGTLSSHGQALGIKWLVHPESSTASSKGGVTRV